MKVTMLALVRPPRSGGDRFSGFSLVPVMLRGLLFIALTVTTLVHAESSANDQPASDSTVEPSTRYGLFGWLDHRSEYGQGIYPEPFLVDDSDLETNEARLDWLHTNGRDQQSDLVTAEVEKGFGLLTLALELPYERDLSAGSVSEGIGNISVGARYPIYQWVSPSGFVDSTFGAGIEVGIPVNSSVSKNAELVPKIFDDLRLGDHFTLQGIFGYSTLFGGGSDGGLQTFEYGFVFGWTIQHDELPVSGLQQLIPVIELSGDTELNHTDRGHNFLLADVGFRANLKTIGRVQPRLGLAFVFPVDRGARDEVHWGLITSLVFEY
ncbi:MAG: hypothetical protein JO279_00025 [Verrucomicrobia bacterium]|nr:hypothetical protein [Verrucomicrobiota bacterium]